MMRAWCGYVKGLRVMSELDPRIARFHADAMGTLESLGDTLEARRVIRERLKELSREKDILPDVDLNRLHTTGSAATILIEGEDGRGALMLLQLPPDAPTPVHNHNSWGVSCVVSGRNRYWRWERLDDGKDANRAEMRLAETHDQEPGDATLWDDPPQDWHAQQGLDGDAYEFVFFGTNPLRRPRAYYDPESHEVTYAFASDMHGEY
jgi:predicted metal-dependent enzyme (double-stranded beta helix superfamily)